MGQKRWQCNTKVQDLEDKPRVEIVKFSEQVEQCGRWPQQGCATMFLLMPKNVTIALAFA